MFCTAEFPKRDFLIVYLVKTDPRHFPTYTRQRETSRMEKAASISGWKPSAMIGSVGSSLKALAKYLGNSCPQIHMNYRQLLSWLLLT